MNMATNGYGMVYIECFCRPNVPLSMCLRRLETTHFCNGIHKNRYKTYSS